MSTTKNNISIPISSTRSRNDDDKASLYTGVLVASALTAGTLFVGKALLTAYLESYLFQPKDNNHKPLESPDKYGLKGEAKKLETANDDSIEIWHLKGQEGKPTVVFQHGNTGNMSYVSKDPKHQEENTAFRIEFLKKLQDKGVETIAVSSRGFGNSSGKPSEANFKQDAKAVADYLEQQNIKPDNTIVTGESLGTSTATILTEEMTKRSKPPAGLTLIAPFSSLRQQVIESTIAPTFLVDMVLDHPLDTDKRLAHIANTAREKQLEPPHLLVISPEDDKIIHPRHGDDLMRTARKNGFICDQQYQNASHVNWDAGEVIDATLKLHERYHTKNSSTNWKERMTKAASAPSFHMLTS